MRIEVTLRGCDIADPPKHISRKLRDDLTVSPSATVHVPRPLRFAVYTEYAPNRFYVPVHWAKTTYPDATFVERRYAGDLTLCSFRGNLKESQVLPVQKTLECLASNGGAVLSLPTGGGKTACALYISTQLRAKTMIVVHKKLLADQWKTRIHEFVPGASVTMIQGGECDVSGDYVIAMIQTLISRSYPHETFNSIRLLVFDEAHHVAAPAFTKCTQFLQCPLTLGLTATPERKDGLQKLLHWSLGPMAHQEIMEDRRDVVVKLHTFNSVLYKQQQPVTAAGMVNTAAMISALTEDSRRNDVIKELVIGMDPERHILVLSHRRAHCESLVQLLHGIVDVGLCIGSKRDFDHRVIVATYALVSEGFDEPRLDTLILATPASDVTQAVGRIMRQRGERHPLIVDIVDMWGSCFAQAAKRKSIYRKSGFRIEQ